MCFLWSTFLYVSGCVMSKTHRAQKKAFLAHRKRLFGTQRLFLLIYSKAERGSRLMKVRSARTSLSTCSVSHCGGFSLPKGSLLRKWKELGLTTPFSLSGLFGGVMCKYKVLSQRIKGFVNGGIHPVGVTMPIGEVSKSSTCPSGQTNREDVMWPLTTENLYDIKITLHS